MVEQLNTSLNDTLKAVSDVTRRSILTTLVQEGPTRVTELAGLYDMSLNSVSKHIKVLEKSGLVTRKTLGRVHLIEANLGPVDAVEDWFRSLRSIWDLRLESLDDLLNQKEKTMAELEMTTSRVFSAAPATVFNAWLNPEMMAKFMTPGPGMSVPEASADPVIGGRFSVLMRAKAGDLPHGGEYKEIDPHSKIVFTWESPFSVDDSTVTLTLKPLGAGTELTLHHIKFADEEQRDNHSGGWTTILATLDDVLS